MLKKLMELNKKNLKILRKGFIMSNKLNDIEYDEVKILIIEELTKYANEHNGFVNNKYLESLDLFNFIDIDDIEEIKTKLAEIKLSLLMKAKI